jgi:protease IV
MNFGLYEGMPMENAFRPLGRVLGMINPLRWVRSGARRLSNWRKLRNKQLDYILFSLPSALPDLPEHKSWWQKRLFGGSGLNLWDFDKLLQRIADDPRPRGVILRMEEPALSLADLQTLRGSLLRFRARGKRLVAYAQGYTLAGYYLASACDEIMLQPGGELMTLGLRRRATFLKNALDRVGVRLDVVAITPYKGALDALSREAISPEGQAQLEWLLDSNFDMVVNGIAEGRKQPPEAVRSMIDGAPYLDSAALAAGYVDAVMHEEGFATHFKVEHLVPYAKARKMLISKPKAKASGKVVALMQVRGLMVSGESGAPPIAPPIPLPFIGDERAGDKSVVQQVRQLMKDESVAAVVLYIESGGGSAVAAEAMTAALDELAKTRPLVVYMNGVAASGGYYIATPAQWIVAQPGTTTGSIGVVTAKPITSGLFEKLSINAVEFKRGQNADLYSEDSPFSDAQRAQVRTSIEHIYQTFITRVANGRKMPLEAVDAVGGGRVWTGAQAFENGLVDELGDLRTALKKARALANLADDAPVVMLNEIDKAHPLPPLRAEPPAAFTEGFSLALLRYWRGNLRHVASGRAQLLLPLHWE